MVNLFCSLPCRRLVPDEAFEEELRVAIRHTAAAFLRRARKVPYQQRVPSERTSLVGPRGCTWASQSLPSGGHSFSHHRQAAPGGRGAHAYLPAGQEKMYGYMHVVYHCY